MAEYPAFLSAHPFDTWPRLPYAQRLRLPQISALYGAVYWPDRDDPLIYIGKAAKTLLRTRWSRHHILSRVPFYARHFEIAWLAAPADDLAEMEWQARAWLQPWMNPLPWLGG